MGLLSRIMAASTTDVMTSADLAKLLNRPWRTNGGAEVSYDSAMQVADVYKCVRIISEDMAKLPIQVLRRIGRGKESAADHWLQALLLKPNTFQTGFEFRELMQAHIELAGNAYAIKTVVRNETRELLPIPPTRVRVELLTEQWELLYHVTLPNGAELPVPADRMLHLKGFSLDGFVGLRPVQYQREAIGLNMQLVEAWRAPLQERRVDRRRAAAPDQDVEGGVRSPEGFVRGELRRRQQRTPHDSARGRHHIRQDRDDVRRGAVPRVAEVFAR
jgi:phage portal protein BeeE